MAGFKSALPIILGHEGGYVDHPKDPGGATNMGITHRTLAAWRGEPVTKQDVKDIGLAEVEAIYRANYWDLVWGDDLPDGLDLVVFDYAVNSGVSRSAKALQKALGVAQDGVIGVITMRAAADLSGDEVSAAINAVCDQRLAFLKRLKTWPTFGKGWERRVAHTREAALAMREKEAVNPVEIEGAQAKGEGGASLVSLLVSIFASFSRS